MCLCALYSEFDRAVAALEQSPRPGPSTFPGATPAQPPVRCVSLVPHSSAAAPLWARQRITQPMHLHPCCVLASRYSAIPSSAHTNPTPELDSTHCPSAFPIAVANCSMYATRELQAVPMLSMPPMSELRSGGASPVPPVDGQSAAGASSLTR